MQGYESQGPLTWQERLQHAGSGEEVVAMAREFMAQFTPYEIHSLPGPCKPPAKIVDALDVASYAYALVRHECGDNDDHAELVHKLAAFYSEGAKRIAYLLGPAHAASQAVSEAAAQEDAA
jgi:hypothetical protein